MQPAQTAKDLGDQTRAALADLIDLQMFPLGLAAMDALELSPGQTVLDIGCGAGQTAFQLAERVGHAGRVIGVDIAPLVLEVARARAEHLPQVSFLHGDAATLVLPDRSLDAAYSRFGVMFFTDPTRAFGNIRRMLQPNGQLGFVCWRSMRENELDSIPFDAAGLEALSDAPHFSFEHPSFIKEVLQRAGFEAIRIEPFDANVACGDIDTTLKVVTHVGALGKLLRENPALRSQAEPPVRAALEERESEGRVSLKAATWVVTARTAQG